MSASLADFKQLSLLGEGAYSAVYKVQRLADGQIYALKKVKLPSLSDKEKQNALNEIRLLASVRHENVISYKEAFFDDETRCLCIVTECADGGDLLQQIVKCQKEKGHLKEESVWRYLLGMSYGIRALHGMKVLHRDLKCANIFLSKEGGATIAKIGDFNVSTVAKRGLCMTQTGTPYYASPEVWRDMPYDGKSDIWSLGCVVYESAALRPPFQAKDMEGLYRKVLRGQYPRLPSHYSSDLSDVIGALLQVNPRHRPSAEQMLQMPVMRAKAVELGMVLEDDGCSDLLRTIKVPRNVIDLSSYLPRPRYDEDDTVSSISRQASALKLPSLAEAKLPSLVEERGSRLPSTPSASLKPARPQPVIDPRRQQPSIDPRRQPQPRTPNQDFLNLLDPQSIEQPRGPPPMPQREDSKTSSGRHAGSQPPPDRRRRERKEHRKRREPEASRERRPSRESRDRRGSRAEDSDEELESIPAPAQRKILPPQRVMPRQGMAPPSLPRLPRILSEPGRLISGT